jgi:hypothetical protein
VFSVVGSLAFPHEGFAGATVFDHLSARVWVGTRSPAAMAQDLVQKLSGRCLGFRLQ